MLLYIDCILFTITRGDRDDHGGKIGAVYRVVNGYSDLKSITTVDKAASDAGPHGLFEKKLYESHELVKKKIKNHSERSDGMGWRSDASDVWPLSGLDIG